MRTKTKIVSLLLCVFMTFTFMPSPAMAAVDSEFIDAGSGLKFKVLTEDTSSGAGTVQLVQNSYSGTSYTIPDMVSDSGITYNVTSIGYGAFADCAGLNSVGIPSGVTDIGNFAFQNCSGLNSISLPEGITGIGISAFSGSGLSSIIIPASVLEIWDWAFSGCTNLTSVTFQGVTPPNINAMVFSGSGVQTVTVPRGAEMIYGFEFSSSSGLPAGADIAPAAAAITEVSVTPATAEVTRGGTASFSAAVEGTGSFSPAVTWSVDSTSGSTFYDGVLTIAPVESKTVLTVTAASVADPGVTGEATVTVLPSTPHEQFSLPAGTVCYFDLSGIAVSEGEVNVSLPDTSIKWVPFTYTGTVDAYSLAGDASDEKNVNSRSLFIADHTVYVNVSWDALNTAGLIFGKDYTANGVSYSLRSLSAGSDYSNEWNQIMVKGAYIHNYDDMFSWGQDTFNSSSLKVIWGYYSLNYWQPCPPSTRDIELGFRPALEIQNAAALGSDGLKTVTFDMDGNGTLGNGMLTAAPVVYTHELTLPAITAANGFTYTGTGTGILGWYDGNGNFYASGTAPALTAGTVLTAGYGAASAPTITTTSLDDGKVGEPYSQSLTVDGDTPISWTVDVGDLPDGLTLSSGGVISGTPTATGTFNFTVKAMNNTGSDTQALSIVIGSTAPVNYTITASAGGGGSISPSGTVSVTAGGSRTFTIAPDSNYSIASVTVDGVDQEAISSYTFTSVRSDHTIRATFTYTDGSDPGYSPRTLTDSGTGISVTGNIREDAVLTVMDLALGDSAVCDAIRQRMNDGDYVFILGKNISLSQGFTGTLTLSIPVGDAYNGETVTVLHCKDGALETYTVAVRDGKATFDVTSLSPFAVFIEDGLDDIPKTGDDNSQWVWWLLGGVSAAGIGLLAVLNKRKKACGKQR